MKYFHIDNIKFNYNLEFNELSFENKWKTNATLLEYCETLGITIPHYCYHKKLSIAGNCRMCLIELKKSPKPVVSCSMNAKSSLATNTEIFTNSPLVRKARENIMEFLLLNHPLDCPICDQGGECDLQDQSLFFGITKKRFYNFKRIVVNKNIGPIVKTIMTRCIHCTRCVRFATEVAGTENLGIFGRGNKSEIGMYVNDLFYSELSGNVVDICPVGALTSKPYPFIGRNWELKSINSIDIADGFASNLQLYVKNNNIIKILPSYDYNENDNIWISDKTRFLFDGMFTPKRNITKTIIFAEDKIKIDSWEFMFKKIILMIYFYNHLDQHFFNVNPITLIIDSNISLEVLNIALLIEKSCPFFQIRKLENMNICNDFESNLQLNSANTAETLSLADTCLLIGTNTRYEGSHLNLKLRKRFLKGNFKLFQLHSLTNLTFPTISLGSNITNLKDIAEGIHPICQELTKSKKLLIIINSNVFSRKDAKTIRDIIEVIETNTKTNIDVWNGFNLLNTSINSTGIHILKKIKTIRQNDLLTSSGLYFINSTMNHSKIANMTELKLLNYLNQIPVKKFHIEQNTNTDSLINVNIKKSLNMYSHFFLPSNTFYETTGTYINTEGITKKATKVISSLKNTKDDWQILQKLFTLINISGYNGLLEYKCNNFSNFTNFACFLNSTHQHLSNMTSYLKNNTNQSFRIIGNKYSTSTKSIYATSFVKQIDDFYIGGFDNYTKISPTMVRCSNNLRAKLTNF